MPTRVTSIEVIAEAAAQHSNCLITTIRRYANKDAFMIVFQPSVRATIDVSGVLLSSSFPNDIVKHLANHMKHTTDDIVAYLNRTDEGTVEEKEDIEIEFSMGAEPPQSTI